MIISKRKYLPLFLIESYLILTLAVFWLGPVKYRIQNEFLFIFLFLLYHVFFILGYFIGERTFKIRRVFKHSFSRRKYIILALFAFLGSMITYKNATNASSLIPFSILQDLVKGFTNPAMVYVESKLNSDYVSAGDSRILNILYMLFAFTRFFFIFYSIWFWKYLRSYYRIISIVYCLFYISPSISSGINSIMFWFVLFSFSTLLVNYYLKNNKRLKSLLISLSILLLIPILSFGYIMSERGGGYSYFEQSSPRGDIEVSSNDVDLEDANIITFLEYTFTWLDYYITQGYYGFSLTLEQEFKWTFGFGNSAFLQRQFNLITGIDIGQYSYQRRYDHVWGEFTQWHSFYGQFANDFSPIGLVLLMFALGLAVSRVWLSALLQNSLYGAALVPIFIIMFIFLPANNQVFGYIDPISYFVFINIFWFVENRKFVK